MEEEEFSKMHPSNPLLKPENTSNAWNLKMPGKRNPSRSSGDNKVDYDHQSEGSQLEASLSQLVRDIPVAVLQIPKVSKTLVRGKNSRRKWKKMFYCTIDIVNSLGKDLRRINCCNSVVCDDLFEAVPGFGILTKEEVKKEHSPTMILFDFIKIQMINNSEGFNNQDVYKVLIDILSSWETGLSRSLFTLFHTIKDINIQAELFQNDLVNWGEILFSGKNLGSEIKEENEKNETKDKADDSTLFSGENAIDQSASSSGGKEKDGHWMDIENGVRSVGEKEERKLGNVPMLMKHRVDEEDLWGSNFSEDFIREEEEEPLPKIKSRDEWFKIGLESSGDFETFNTLVALELSTMENQNVKENFSADWNLCPSIGHEEGFSAWTPHNEHNEHNGEAFTPDERYVRPLPESDLIFFEHEGVESRESPTSSSDGDVPGDDVKDSEEETNNNEEEKQKPSPPPKKISTRKFLRLFHKYFEEVNPILNNVTNVTQTLEDLSKGVLPCHKANLDEKIQEFSSSISLSKRRLVERKLCYIATMYKEVVKNLEGTHGKIKKEYETVQECMKFMNGNDTLFTSLPIPGSSKTLICHGGHEETYF